MHILYLLIGAAIGAMVVMAIDIYFKENE